MDCIYVLRNNKTNRSYVGRTYHPNKRFRQHMNLLKARTHPNNLMQYDFERFGVDSFEFEVVLEKENLGRTYAEGEWMKKLKTYDPRYGYNFNDPYFRKNGNKPTINLINCMAKDGLIAI